MARVSLGVSNHQFPIWASCHHLRARRQSSLSGTSVRVSCRAPHTKIWTAAARAGSRPSPPRTDGNCCSCSSNCFQTGSVCRGRPMAKAGGSAAQIRNKKPPLGPSFSRFSPWPSRCSTRRRNRQTSKAVAAVFDSLWSSCLVMVCRGGPWVAFAGTMLPTEPSMDPLSGH